MRHYDETQWADFARGLVPETQRRAMRQHLDAGCRRCAATLALQRTVVAVADADRRLAAPDYAVRQIKGFFALNRPARWSRLAPIQLGLRWDSGLEPAPAGSRGAAGERQVAYASGEYGLDLRFSSPPREGEPGVLTGALARAGGEPVARVPAFLVVGDRVVDQTTSDESGHFELAARLERPSEVWVEVAAGECIAVTIDPAS